MGRKGRLPDVIKVDPRNMENRRMLSCFMEMMAFMSCLKGHNFDAAQCQGAIAALNMCMEGQSKKGRSRSTLNYHLQRISREM